MRGSSLFYYYIRRLIEESREGSGVVRGRNYRAEELKDGKRCQLQVYVVANADSIQKVELGIIVVLVLDRQFLLTLLELPITTSPVTTEKTS